jgi:hypothetical protein
MQKIANKIAQAEEAIKVGATPTASSTTVVQASSGQVSGISCQSCHGTPTALPTTVIQDMPVVKETIREREREEIQPVLHREVEQPIIRKVTAPVSEVRNLQEQQIYAHAAPEFREIKAPALTSEQQAMLAQRELPEAARFVTHEQVVLPTKVHEVVKEKIVEEVQPVIYREVYAPRTIHVEKDIFEKQVLPTQVVQEVRPMGTYTAPLAQTAQFTSTTSTTTHTYP